MEFTEREYWWWLPSIYLCVPKSRGIFMRRIAPLSYASGIWQWFIVNLALAVNTLQRHSLCKLSLVSFNFHFIYFVIQLTVSSCPKLPLPIVFCPIFFTPCHCSWQATPYLLGVVDWIFHVTWASHRHIEANQHRHGYSLPVTVFYWKLGTRPRPFLLFLYILHNRSILIIIEVVIVCLLSLTSCTS